MLRALLSGFLLLLSVATAWAADCADSTQTRLALQFAPPPWLSPHGPLGQTQLVLRDKASGQVIKAEALSSEWRCLGYAAADGRYLLGGIGPSGAWRPLTSLRYLDEKTGELLPSVLDKHYFVVAVAIVSPQGRYVAFLGGHVSVQLYLLDTRRNTLRKLADDVPLPPPDRQARETCRGIPFAWGECWGDRYMELERDVLAFESETRLRVSYGADTPKRRAAKRRVRYFDWPAENG